MSTNCQNMHVCHQTVRTHMSIMSKNCQKPTLSLPGCQADKMSEANAYSVRQMPISNILTNCQKPTLALSETYYIHHADKLLEANTLSAMLSGRQIVRSQCLLCQTNTFRHADKLSEANTLPSCRANKLSEVNSSSPTKFKALLKK